MQKIITLHLNAESKIFNKIKAKNMFSLLHFKVHFYLKKAEIMCIYFIISSLKLFNKINTKIYAKLYLYIIYLLYH